MNNIKKIYQHAGKCDDQQNLKYIIDDAILSTPEGVTDNSPNVHMTSKQVKKPSARKSLCLFTTAVLSLVSSRRILKNMNLLFQ